MREDTVRLLLVEDSGDDAERLLRSLRRQGWSLEHRRVQTKSAMRQALQSTTPWDAVISDWEMPRFSGLHALQALSESGLDLPFIIVSGAIGEEKAVQAMRAGAHDYVHKDDLRRLAPAIEREVREARRRHDQRQTEDQLRQAQKLEAVGQLAGGIAHDFNNLLTSIISFTGFVAEDLEPGDPKRADLEEVLRAAESASRLTAQLLSFSRRRPIDPVVVDLQDAILGAVKMLSRTLGERIELVVVPIDERLRVLIDPGQLDQVIFNLAVNARDAMAGGGVLSLTTAALSLGDGEELPPGRYVGLSVSDSGAGISAENIERIFEPFFSTKGEGGTGLGLSTVHGIVGQAGGDVQVSSEEGRGTRFTIRLPLTDQEPQPRGFSQADPSFRVDGAVALAVEDQPAILRMMSRTLRASGFSVVEAQTAEEALALATEQQTVDLLVTDVVLPGLSGIQLAERVQERHPGARVVLSSGYMDADQRPQISPRSRTAFLPKPFSATELSAKVQAVFSAAAQRDSIL